MEETASGFEIPPLEWGSGLVQLECVFLGKTHRFEHVGSFLRIGSDPRCELCIPGLPAPVCVYLQLGKDYVAVLELVDSDPIALCEPVYALPGATVWLQPNARITIESIRPLETKAESFSWENFNVDDVKVFPNTLVARSGYFSRGSQSAHLRIQSAFSVLGSSPSCQLRPEHKHVGRFQAVIFRGEQHGEPCRIVDLFAEHTTMVDDQPANGQVLEVGSQLKIVNLTFEAVRLLYNASRPSQIVEVRSQFTTLPLADRQEDKSNRNTNRQVNSPSQSSETKNKQVGSLPDLQSMKDRLARAIGFDNGTTQTRQVHFPIDQEIRPTAGVGLESPNDSRIADGLDRVAKSQERIANEFDKLTARLQGIEESLEQIPEILDHNSQQLTDSIDSLRELVHQVAKTAPISTQNGSTQNQRVDPPVQPAPIKIDKPPVNKPPVKPPPSKSKSSTNKSSSVPVSNKTLPQGRKQKNASENPPKESKQTWLERTRTNLTTWFPNTATRRREIAERSQESDPLNIGSQATAKRTRVRHLDDESELLSASDSADETLVLGSLIGLRYRDARKSFLRWTLFAVAVLLTALVGGPLIWKQIPDGWRELIWQKITLTPTPQDPEYIPASESSRTDPPQSEQASPEDPAGTSEPAISTDSEPSSKGPPKDLQNQ